MKVNNLVIKWMYGHDQLMITGAQTIITSCIVITNEDEKVIGRGIAECSPKDTYNKEVGRRLSMQRALLTTNLSKSERGEVWEKYRTLTKEPRWKTKTK